MGGRGAHVRILLLGAVLGLLAPCAAAQDEPAEPASGPAAAQTAASEPASGPAAAQSEADGPAAPPAQSATEDDGTDVQTLPVYTSEDPPADGATMLDVIEVTASKRLKSQRDLPGSVGAIRGDKLEKMNAQSLSDYLKLIPGVSMADYGTDRQVPVIRGIASSTDGNQFTAYTTGVWLEEMPFNDLFLPLSIPDLNPFDLERVEVLKGPQGTLFGASALAGAIRYIPQKPNLGVWQGKAAVGMTMNDFADTPARVGAAALNAPIGDEAAVRIVGVSRRDGGLYDAVPNGNNTRDEEDIDQLDQASGRVLARWDATETLQLSALAFAQDTQRDDDGNANRPDAYERNDIPFPGPSRSRFGGGTFSVGNDFGWGRVQYIGNVLEKRLRSLSRLEPGLSEQLGNQETLAWYTYFNGKITGNTHELRLSSPEGAGDWEWLAGAAFMSYQQDYFQFTPNPGPANAGYYADPPENPDDVAEADQPTQFLWATVVGDATERALFGEVTGRLGEYWEATLGLRAFETRLDADTLYKGVQITALQPGQTESGKHFKVREQGLNPKVSLRYLHDRNMQAYALVSRGFQFGGVQISPPIANTEQAAEDRGFGFGPYDSSVLWNYELGLRTEWLDRRLRFDVAAFYLDWTDLQLTVLVPLNPVPIPAPPGSGIPRDVPIDVIVNVGAAHSEGLEAVLQVIPFTGATFTSSAAWISALIDEEFDSDHPDGPVAPGTRLPTTPNFQWANAFEYEHALPGLTSWLGGVALTHSHIGESPNDLRPTNTVGGYDTIDVRLSLARPGLLWLPEIRLGVSNLTDVRAVTSYTGDGDTQNFYYLVPPRTTLLSLTWATDV